MIRPVERIMLWPQVVPIRMAIKLEGAGIPNPSSVHEHIRNGTLQSLQGIGRIWEGRIVEAYSSTPRQLAKDVLAGKTEFVDTQIGLDAGGFLLLAESHLRKAKERFEQKPLRRNIYEAKQDTVKAINLVRHALKELKEE